MNIASLTTAPISSPSRRSPIEKSSPLPASPAPNETVELSAAPPRPNADTPALAERGGKVMQKVLAGLGFGLVALSLAGCTGGGGAPTPAPPVNQQQQGQQAEAKTYTQRLEQLRSQTDKTGYYQMVDAGYQKAVLERFAKLTDPAAKPIQELAQKGLEAFNFNADPAAQQKTMREVMKAIAEMKSESSEVTRYTQAAQAVLKTSEGFAANASKAPGGIVAQVKSRGYEEGLKAALEKLRQAPSTVSGYDPGLLRNYVESLTIGPEVALDFSAQLGDPGLSTVLFEQTGDVLYQRVKGDGQVLGGQVTAALELIQKLRQQFGI